MSKQMIEYEAANITTYNISSFPGIHCSRLGEFIDSAVPFFFSLQVKKKPSVAELERILTFGVKIGFLHVQ
jgi:hypothetical protein